MPKAKAAEPAKKPRGKPVTVPGGKGIKVYLDPQSIAIARSLCKESISEGIRIALASAKKAIPGE